MTKIPFTLDAWLKDKSQKVETREGRIVHNIWPVEPLIVCGKKADVCALIDGEEDALVFFEGGKYLPANAESPFDLFIVTPEPEPELSEFEKELESFYNHHLQVCTYDNQGTVEDSLHDGASKLLALARKELEPEIKAEALKGLPRWKKDKSFETEGTFIAVKGKEFFLVKDGYSISVAELSRNFPGFNED